MLNTAFGLPERLEDHTLADAIRLTRAAIYVKDSAFLHFNLACFYSASSRITESLMEIETALEQGFNNWDRIAQEPALREARRTAEFWQIINRYNSN